MFQMKVGLDLERDEKHVKAVRRAIGPAMELMVDANHAYSLAEAVELSRQENLAIISSYICKSYKKIVSTFQAN